MKYKYLFLLLILLDISYSFVQHYHITLDGDMANIILPAERYQPLMADPLGISVLTDSKNYASPNRFFAHWTMSYYFKTVPFFLQKFVNPIESIYLASALMKTIVQVLILWLLAVYISGKKKWTDEKFLLAAILITPLFHTTGYYNYMGIIDHSITYTMFYALPFGLLLIFFLPFYEHLFFGKNIQTSMPGKLALFLLAFFLSLNGPLIPAIVLLCCPTVLLIQWKKHFQKNKNASFVKSSFAAFQKINSIVLFFFTMIILFCWYSFFVGTHTSEGIEYWIPISERYQKLPAGLYFTLTTKLGFPLLFLMIIINLWLMKNSEATEERKRIFDILKWIGFFAIVYILLLPLGGYREYRPNIIRRDTFLPVTFGIIYAYGLTSFYLIKNILPKFKKGVVSQMCTFSQEVLPELEVLEGLVVHKNSTIKKGYVTGIVVFLLIFASVDIPDFQNNQCEKSALETIAASDEKVVLLKNDCLVMFWQKIDDPKHSEINAEMLEFWGVTEGRKLFYQE